MRIAVIGAAGAMGRIIVRDLAALRRVTRGLRRRFAPIEADATVPASLVRALDGAAGVINACHHDLNLRVMDAALSAGAHYCDLGGLFHVTRRQLALNKAFARAGRLAVCGIGSAPGIVNVMASAATEGWERVDAIHIAVGTHDGTPRDGAGPLDTSYSIQTVLDEASQPAALFTGGRMTWVEPLSGAEAVKFPRPVGIQHPACTLHSELATLPGSFRDRGIRDVSFRIAFPNGLDDRLRLVRALGLTSSVPIAVNGQRVVPRDLLLSLLAATRAKTPPSTRPKARDNDNHKDEYEVLRVTARGRQRGRRIERVLDCHVPGMPDWGIGVDIDTGAPPSIVMQMIVTGAIRMAGVLPPERAIPPAPFFRELRRRGMRIVQRSIHARRDQSR